MLYARLESDSASVASDHTTPERLSSQPNRRCRERDAAHVPTPIGTSTISACKTAARTWSPEASLVSVIATDIAPSPRPSTPSATGTARRYSSRKASAVAVSVGYRSDVSVSPVLSTPHYQNARSPHNHSVRETSPQAPAPAATVRIPAMIPKNTESVRLTAR